MAQRVGIITDSTSDIPENLARELDIAVIPLKVFFGRLEFLDGINLSAEEFYGRLIESDTVCATSMPSPNSIREVYEKMAGKYESLVSIHLSSELSGTFAAAQIAAKDMPETDIKVVDSRTVSVGLLSQVLAAARAAQSGAGPDDIMEVISYVRDSTEIYIILDSLESLERGGRIGSAAALLGGLLGVKPVLTVKDGVIFPWIRVRSKKKAFRRICDMLRARKSENPESAVWVAVGHGASPKGAKALAELIRAEFNPDELIHTHVGPTLGAHTGPGVDVVAFFLQ